MKPAIAIVTALSAAALLVAGCKKAEEAAPPTPAEKSSAKAETPLSAAADTVKETAKTAVAEGQKAVETVKAETQKIVADAAKQLTNQTDGATSQFSNLYNQAKTYVAEKKYQEALGSVQKLSALKLTPEQQKAVDDLKVQVQKLMASQTVTNILGGFGK